MSGHEQRPGDWRIICQRSGFKGWASETVIEEKTGLRVLKRFADPKHPQDDLRGRPDNQGVPFANPPPATDTFLAPGDVTAADL